MHGNKPSTPTQIANTFDDYGDKALAAVTPVIAVGMSLGWLPAEWQATATVIAATALTIYFVVRDLVTTARKREAQGE